MLLDLSLSTQHSRGRHFKHGGAHIHVVTLDVTHSALKMQAELSRLALLLDNTYEINDSQHIRDVLKRVRPTAPAQITHFALESTEAFHSLCRFALLGARATCKRA